MTPSALVRRLALTAALLGAAAACSTDPYPIGTGRQPPWQPGSVDTQPTADPYPIGTLRQSPWQLRTADELPAAGPRRFAFCYAKPLNDEAEVRALAEESCDGGRLVVEDRDAFWNGCSLLQPMRITYLCHPVAALPQSE